MPKQMAATLIALDMHMNRLLYSRYCNSHHDLLSICNNIAIELMTKPTVNDTARRYLLRNQESWCLHLVFTMEFIWGFGDSGVMSVTVYTGEIYNLLEKF